MFYKSKGLLSPNKDNGGAPMKDWQCFDQPVVSLCEEGTGLVNGVCLETPVDDGCGWYS